MRCDSALTMTFTRDVTLFHRSAIGLTVNQSDNLVWQAIYKVSQC